MQPKNFLFLLCSLFFLNILPAQGQNTRLPLSWQQTTYLVDTLAGTQVYRQLLNTTLVRLADKGAIQSVVQRDFSINHPNGLSSEDPNFYYPALNNRFSEKDETNPQLIKMAAEEFFEEKRSTADYTFEYDKNGNVRSIIGRKYWLPNMYFYYDENNQWTKVVKQILGYRNDRFTYEITEREIQYDRNKTLPPLALVFLTSNGEDIFQKSRKNIVDYYVLAKLSEVFYPANDGGTFDIRNGFFENTDEGTGAELVTAQMALFRTAAGQAIIAFNEFTSAHFRDAEPPSFYGFENGRWVKKSDVFPKIQKEKILGGPTPSEEEQVTTHFILPQRGLAIQYVIYPYWLTICNKPSHEDVYPNKAERCSWLKQLDRTQANILFDKRSGRFIY
jgi:hypothetical protein